MKMNPYINFAGTAEEALNLYKEVFGGEIQELGRFGESMEVSDDYKQKILHAKFVFGNNLLMVSDSMQGQPVQEGGNIHLSIDLDDEKKMEEIFQKLSEGGKITMPLQDTFWGARFGMLVDKYGVGWMFNHDKPKQ
ncbi:MAG: VOC family protein [Chitinophagaceae bacterium]